jgi:hypothetical protein
MRDQDTIVQKRLRWIITFTVVLAWLSSYYFTITVFAWGVGAYTGLYLILYPSLLGASILIIANVRLGYILSVILAFCYSFLLTGQVGEYYLYKSGSPILLLAIVLPYILFLSLVPLNVCYLTWNTKGKRIIVYCSIFAALSIPAYSIAERYDKDYTESLFADIELTNNGSLIITCKPGFADSRMFVIKSNSRELYKAVKLQGEFYQGSFFVMDLRVTRHFNFRNFRSLSIKQVNKYKLKSTLTWNKGELKGDSSFLLP